MGQYYYPIFLKGPACNVEEIKAWMNAHEYNDGLKLMEHSYIDNNFMNTVEHELGPNGAHFMSRVVWAGDYADVEQDFDANLYHLCEENTHIIPSEKAASIYQYVVNHTKKQFVDKAKVPEREGSRIHPLSILTCEGNGRGNGDFRGEHELIGYWARDVISMHFKRPVGFIEILFDVQEG
jgi:hypothetical protein